MTELLTNEIRALIREHARSATEDGIKLGIDFSVAAIERASNEIVGLMPHLAPTVGAVMNSVIKVLRENCDEQARKIMGEI